MPKLKRELSNRKFWQDKTYSMIEKMTFAASEMEVGKKLLFQSSKCAVSMGLDQSQNE